MAVNKNFVVKNGIEVSTDLIFTDVTNRKVGIASTQPSSMLDVRGGIGATDINISGVATIATLKGVGALDATTTTTIESAIASGPNNFNDLKITGMSTFIGIATFGTGIDVQSGISTFSADVHVSGVVTAPVGGAVTYYGDGSKLSHVSSGIGIGTTAGVVGYGATFIDFQGPGFTTAIFDPSVSGIATLFFEGGGGGATVSIGTTAPTTKSNGDLWFNNELGRTFIYYDEETIGIGTQKVWVDAAPFNIGHLDNVSVAMTEGTLAKPSLYFTGDTDTGLYLAASNTLGFAAGATKALTVSSTGIAVTGNATVSGNLNVTGDIVYDEVSGRNLNITGVSTFNHTNTTSLNATGVSTFGSSTGVGTVVLAGVAGTALWVDGDARVLGILTIGRSSITLDGSNNNLRVGTGITLDASDNTIRFPSGGKLGGARDDGNFTGIVTAAGGFGIGIQSAGITRSERFTALNFIGAGNTIQQNGTVVDISIAGGGGGDGAIGIQSSGTRVAYGITDINVNIGGSTSQNLVSTGTTVAINIDVGDYYIFRKASVGFATMKVLVAGSGGGIARSDFLGGSVYTGLTTTNTDQFPWTAGIGITISELGHLIFTVP